MTRNWRSFRFFPVLTIVILLALLSSPTVAQGDKPDEPVLSAKAANGSITVSWDPVETAVSYELRVWWDPLSFWQDIGGNNITGNSFIHTNLTAGRKYYYTARSVNAAGKKSGWQHDFAFAVVQQGSAPAATNTPAVVATNTPAVVATNTPAPTATPGPVPTVTPLSVEGNKWCRVAQENTIQGGTLDKYRILFPDAQAPSYPDITEVWNRGNQTVVMYELDGFYRHSDGRAGIISGVEYYSACTYTGSKIWFVPFEWYEGDIIILLRTNRDHNDKP